MGFIFKKMKRTRLESGVGSSRQILGPVKTNANANVIQSPGTAQKPVRWGGGMTVAIAVAVAQQRHTQQQKAVNRHSQSQSQTRRSP